MCLKQLARSLRMPLVCPLSIFSAIYFFFLGRHIPRRFSCLGDKHSKNRCNFFAVIFAVFAPRQDGVRNRQKVYIASVYICKI